MTRFLVLTLLVLPHASQAAESKPPTAPPEAATSAPTPAAAPAPAPTAAPAGTPAQRKVISIEAAMAAELQDSKEGPLNVYTGIGLVDGLNIFGLAAVPTPVPALSPEAMPEGDEAEANEDADGKE